MFAKILQMKIYACLLLIVLLSGSCKTQIPIDDIENSPIPSEADNAFANVYQSLHGNWVGDFEIFRDDNQAPRDDEILYNLNPSLLNRPNVNSIRVIRVHQRYESLSPYFQKVDIQDFYQENGATVMSKGVNKIQDGKMWCVVRKPDETVIHEGSTDGPETIIWQRNESNPQKIEYFRETVSGDRYTILGWGYYEGDDPTLMPRYWFYGTYKRDY